MKYKRCSYDAWKDRRATLGNVEIKLFGFLNPGMFVSRTQAFLSVLVFYIVIDCTVSLAGAWLHGERIPVFTYL